MKHDPLNNRLLKEFPYLEKTYASVKDGAFDLDTPAYSFYEEIFVPYILMKIEKNDKEEIRHCFAFIEEMMEDEDEIGQDVMMQSVLCPLYEKKGSQLKSLPLGRLSLAYVKEWLEI